jgi:hypothetical protein
MEVAMETGSAFSSAVWGVLAFLVVAGLLRWWTRCRHPSPHYERPLRQRDPVTGVDGEIRPARYTCFDCGKSWRAEQRDPAWAPSRVKQAFRGHDETLASRAAMRAAIVDEQRRFLAANRTAPPARAADGASPRRGRVKPRRPSNVTDINSRRPA